MGVWSEAFPVFLFKPGWGRLLVRRDGRGRWHIYVRRLDGKLIYLAYYGREKPSAREALDAVLIKHGELEWMPIKYEPEILLAESVRVRFRGRVFYGDLWLVKCNPGRYGYNIWVKNPFPPFHEFKLKYVRKWRYWWLQKILNSELDNPERRINIEEWLRDLGIEIEPASETELQEWSEKLTEEDEANWTLEEEEEVDGWVDIK